MVRYISFHDVDVTYARARQHTATATCMEFECTTIVQHRSNASTVVLYLCQHALGCQGRERQHNTPFDCACQLFRVGSNRHFFLLLDNVVASAAV